MTTFEEIKAQSAVVQAHLDTISDLIHLATTVNNIVQMQAVKIILEAESARMTRESDKLNDLFKQFREEKRKTEEGKLDMKKSTIVLIVLMMVVALLLAGIARAQDAPPLATNTSEVVATVTAAVNGQPVEATLVAPVENPAPAQQPISDNMLTVIGLVMFTIVTLIGQFISHKSLKEMTATVNKTLDNKALLDEATSRYMQSSLQTQEYIRLGVGFAQLLGKSIPGDDLLDKIGELGGRVIGGDTQPTGEQAGLIG